MKNKSVKREVTSLQQSLFSQLNDIMRVDQRRLSARIHGIGKIKSQETQQAVVDEIQQQIEQARVRVESRKSAVQNPIVFPESLPVSQRKAEIEKLLSEHQVIVVAGETDRIRDRHRVWPVGRDGFLRRGSIRLNQTAV